MNKRWHALPSLEPFDYKTHGPSLARLDCNEVPEPPGADELRRFHQALGAIAFNRYPDMTGLPLRKALAKHWGLAPDEILVGNGSIDTLCILLQAHAAAPGEPAPHLLYPDPSFDYYSVAARTHGFVPVAVPLTERFQLNEGALKEHVLRHRPAVCLFASPNNPTGNRFGEDALCRLAEQALGAFVVDEAYADYTAHSLLQWARSQPRRFVMRSFSKIGFAGLRLGALVGAKESIAELHRVRVPWNVNALSLALGCAVVQHPESYRTRVRETIALRAALERQLKTVPGLTVYPSEANFLLVRCEKDAKQVFDRLLSEHVLVKYLSRPGLLHNCLRVSVGNAQENDQCVAAFKRAAPP